MPAKFDSLQAFTDRNAEIAVFDSFWEKDRKWILCFHGESGIGKTLLINWLLKNKCGVGKDKILALKTDLRSDDSNLCENILDLVKKIVEPFSKLDEPTYRRFNTRTKGLQSHPIVIEQNVIAQGGGTISGVLINANTSDNLPTELSSAELDNEIIEFANNLTKRKHVAFIFDHYELLQRKKNDVYRWLWAILDKFHQRLGNLRVILACQDVPEIPPQFENEKEVIELKSFSDEDIKALFSHPHVNFSTEDYFVRKIKYFTKGNPFRLDEVMRSGKADELGVAPINLIRQRLWNEVARRESRIQSLRPPYNAVVPWASLLRRFDQQFLNSIPEKPYANLKLSEFLELMKVGFQVLQNNFLMSPQIVRETQHFMINQELPDTLQFFYQGVKEISSRRIETDPSFFYDELYYDFMLNQKDAYQRWRNELDNEKKSMSADRWHQLVLIGEEAQFVLKDDLAGEVFLARGDFAAENQQWQAALDFYQFAQELFEEVSADRAANVLLRISNIHRMQGNDEHANAAFYEAFNILRDKKPSKIDAIDSFASLLKEIEW